MSQLKINIMNMIQIFIKDIHNLKEKIHKLNI